MSLYCQCRILQQPRSRIEDVIFEKKKIKKEKSVGTQASVVIEYYYYRYRHYLLLIISYTSPLLRQ